MSEISNTAPLIKDGKALTRRFTGKTEDFKDKKEKAFYTKMLKYYVKGASNFPIGKNVNGSTKYAKVDQEYSYKK